jgi:DNA-binding IclR family transcriptional regulator
MRKSTQEKNAPPMPARGGPQSVGRIFAILETLSQSNSGASLSELAVRTDAPKTSLVGLLAGLTAERCLLRDAAGRYFLGPRFLSLAMQAISGRELLTLARPVLEKLVEETGETAVLGALVPDADLAIYLDKVESSNPIRYAVTVGERRHLYCTALGKVLLAYFEPDRLKRYLKATPLKRFTPTTITKASNLKADLAGIRQQGLSYTSDERISGASGIGAAIFSADGGVVAALAIAGPSERLRLNTVAIAKAVKRAAAECTRLSGGSNC